MGEIIAGGGESTHTEEKQFKKGFKERLYDDPDKVGPAMLEKTALVHNLRQKSKRGFTERLYDDPDKVGPAMLDKTALVHNL